MLFRVHRPLQYGSTLYLTGSTIALSKWDVSRGIPCKWTTNDIWQHGAVGTGENHVVILTTGSAGRPQVEVVRDTEVRVDWGKGNEMGAKMISCLPPKKLPNTKYVTINFKLDYKTGPGEQRVYILGSLPQLGKWNKMHSPLLENNKRLQLDIPLSCLTEAFEYKYFVRYADGTRKWEDGENRIAKPLLMSSVLGGPHEPQNGTAETVVEYDDRWERLCIEFSIYFPGTSERDVMHITGDIAEIGAWFKPGPVPMELGPEQVLETDVRGRKWVKRVWVPMDQAPFSYRYILINKETKFELWEREPNRHSLDISKINSIHVLKDVNFVSEMKFDYVPRHISIGPYPQSPADVDTLAKQGITAVLNVQTDEDFEHRAIQWKALSKRYDEQGIKVVRYPIRDFDRDSLKARLHGGAHQLHDMIEAGKHVYVHCTAGMGRAPAVVVAYLCWVHGMGLDEAVKHVKKYRTVAVPNVPVLEMALQQAF